MGLRLAFSSMSDEPMSGPSFEPLTAERLATLVNSELSAGESPFADVVVPNRHAMVASWLLLYFADEAVDTPDVLRPVLRRVGSELESLRRCEGGLR